MRAFRAEADGYVAALNAAERLVLAQVVGDVVEMLQAQVPSREAADDGPSDGPDDSRIDGVSAVRLSMDAPAPTDPAVRRLLPDASRDDAEVTAEFRRLTQDDLAQEKSERLLFVADLLLEPAPSDDVEELVPLLVTREDAQRVAGALTDVRLVLAERIGLETDEQAERLHDEVLGEDDDEGAGGWSDADDDVDDDVDDDSGAGHGADRPEPTDGPRRFLGSVFLLTGWLLESLVDGMLADLRARRG